MSRNWRFREVKPTGKFHGLLMSHLAFLFQHTPNHYAFRLTSPPDESEIAISEFKTPRSRAKRGSREVTPFRAWQKTWRKKTAEECRIVQEIAGRQDEKNPAKNAKHGVLAT
jgi:hypothetical protein